MWLSLCVYLLVPFLFLRGTVVVATRYNCSQFFTMPDGSLSTEDISSHLASKNCKADSSLMTLFNSRVGRNMFDALAMATANGPNVDSCDAFVTFLSFAVTNSWLDELCASGTLNTPASGDQTERDYCRDANTHSGQLQSAIQTLETHPALKGLSNLSKMMKSFTDDPKSCQVVCGSFLEAALCDGVVNLVAFVSSKLRNGAEFNTTNVPSFDTPAFGRLNLDYQSGSDSRAQELFMYWWFISNGYHPTQGLAKVDIQTEYARFVEWKKEKAIQQVSIPSDVKEINLREAAAVSPRSGARRSRFGPRS